MPIFLPKTGTLFSTGRFLHLFEASTVTLCGALIWSFTGAILVGLGAILAGFLWEVSNRYTSGYHQFGDVIDFVAFVVGVAFALAVSYFTLM